MVKSKMEQGRKSVPLVSTSMIMPVIRAYEAQGGNTNKLLSAHGITADQINNQDAFITHDCAYSLFIDVAKHTSPDFCALVGRDIDHTRFQHLAPKLGETVTVGDFITRFTTAMSTATNSVSLSLLVEGEYAYFTATRTFMPKASPAQVDAFQVSMWITLLHRVLDFRWDPTSVVVRLHDPKVLPVDFHGVRPIACSAKGYSFRFPSEWLSHKLKSDALAQSSGDLPNPELSAPGDLLSSLRNVLSEKLSEPGFGVEAAAEACGYKVDTLNRRLAAFDTTISGIFADLRKKEAELALEEGVESIAEIALRLGYSDATAFSRAFKKWTGSAPTVFRTRFNKGG